jgi:hypothetical protein
VLGERILPELHQPRGGRRFVAKIMSEKNYDKYAYFVSRANNFAIVIRPDKKKIVDGETVFESGLRVEFKNKMLRIEKTEDNQFILDVLKEKLKKEEQIDPKRRSFYEETKPESMIPESKVKDALQKKNEEIERLKKELDKKSSKSK